MTRSCILLVLLVAIATGCANDSPETVRVLSAMDSMASIKGKSSYLASPFVTAGDRVYLVGNQDGTFPDMGWHITGEMGGVWDHPIKLLDGFGIAVASSSGNTKCLRDATEFTNFPIGNRHQFLWPEEELEITRAQFIPDTVEGLFVELTLSNKGSKAKDLTVYFTGMIDLRPTWLGERTGMTDGVDDFTFDEKSSAWMAKDANNEWYVMVGSSLPAKQSKEVCDPIERKGQGKNATLSYTITVPSQSQQTIPFFIAGSYQSEKSLRKTFEVLKSNASELVKKKASRFNTIDQRSNIAIPDAPVQEMYRWLKYNTDWLIRNVPEQGTGLSAGLPDYPWWFGADATYALQGVLATGNHELAKSTILLLHKISEQTNSNGRVVHEVSTNGSVYNPGNLNETAQFITLVSNYYRWTGDRELVTTLYPSLKKGMDWLLKERDPDGNRYPNGSGMMEIPGLESELEMIDVAVYTQQALASAAELAHAVGESEDAAGYQKMADDLKVRINQEWWNEDQKSFGDFRGTKVEAQSILAAALIRADTLGKAWSVAELRGTQDQMKRLPSGKSLPHVIYHNWVVNTPMETGIADMNKGKAALSTALRYENAYGVFVTGIDRTEEADSIVLKSRKKIFSYTGAVMTLPTGVQAVAAARYGAPENALEYLQKLNRSFSYALPGSMYEVSPDFGMVTQAWNLYGVAVPLVHYFFGIDPHAPDQKIKLAPRFPQSWNEATISEVRIGSNSLGVSFKRQPDHHLYTVTQTIEDWTIEMDIPRGKKIILNDQEIEAAQLVNGKLNITGKSNVVKIYR